MSRMTETHEGDGGAGVSAAAANLGGAVRDQAKEYYQQGKAKVIQAREGVEGFVRERPLQSLLIAAGVGLVIGMLLRSRRD